MLSLACDLNVFFCHKPFHYRHCSPIPKLLEGITRGTYLFLFIFVRRQCYLKAETTVKSIIAGMFYLHGVKPNRGMTKMPYHIKSNT